MWGFAEDLPRGSGIVLTGLFLLLLAGFSAVAGIGRPSPYHELTTIHGVVTNVSSANGTVYVDVNLLPAALPTGETSVLLEDPELSGARARLRALPVGAHISAEYDTWTQRVWQLDPVAGRPGFGEREIAEWRAADHDAGVLRARWLLAIGLVTIAVGLVRVVRGTDDAAPPLPRRRGRPAF